MLKRIHEGQLANIRTVGGDSMQYRPVRILHGAVIKWQMEAPQSRASESGNDSQLGRVSDTETGIGSSEGVEKVAIWSGIDMDEEGREETEESV